MKPFLAILILIVRLPMGSAQDAVKQPAAGNPLDTFRSIVSGNVPIREMIINDPYRKADTKQVVNRYYRIAWQVNTWFVEEIEPSNKEFTSWQRKGSINGVSFDKVWSVGDQAVAFTDRNDNRLWPGSSSNVVENGVGFQRAWPLSLFVTAGLLWVPPHTLRWEGPTNFTGERWVSTGNSKHKTEPILGQIGALGPKGPTVVTYHAASSPGTNYVIQYSYNKELPAGIPSSWTWSVEVNGKLKFEPPVKEIMSVVLGEEDLTASQGYVPSLFTNVQRQFVVVYTNSTMYQMDRVDGVFHQAPPRDVSRNVAKQVYIVIGAVLSSISLFAFLRVRTRSAT